MSANAMDPLGQWVEKTEQTVVHAKKLVAGDRARRPVPDAVPVRVLSNDLETRLLRVEEEGSGDVFDMNWSGAHHWMVRLP